MEQNIENTMSGTKDIDNKILRDTEKHRKSNLEKHKKHIDNTIFRSTRNIENTILRNVKT